MVAALTTANADSVSEKADDLPDTISEDRSHMNVGGAIPALPIRHNGRALTARQATILQFILDHKSSRGYPPTLREIGKAFGIRSTNGVNDHLRALERKGHIVRGDMLSRGIRVVNPLTGAPVADVPDPRTFVMAENIALRTLLRRISVAGARAPILTAELVILLGDVRAVLRTVAGT